MEQHPDAETSAWGPVERANLRRAIAHAGHNQTACAAELVERHGADHASQALVSRWLSGAIATPRCVRALEAYCAEHRSDAGEDHAPEMTTSPGDDLGAEAPTPDETGWQVALEFSRQIDSLRGELRAERSRSRALAHQVERLARQLSGALEGADRIDDAADTYSRALFARRYAGEDAAR